MRVEQLTYSSGRWWTSASGSDTLVDAQLVLAFGDPKVLSEAGFLPELRTRYPDADIVLCSGGCILGTHTPREGITATAVQFDSVSVRSTVHCLDSASASEAVGRQIAAELAAPDLRHVLVFSEGLSVNGSALAAGLATALPKGVAATGGLAADGDAFGRTATGLNAAPRERQVVAVGLYGGALSVATSSYGGWDVFGDELKITRSVANELFELDGRPALGLYRELLGPLGYGLPASGLSFPLQICAPGASSGVIRTILGVNEETGSVIFAGDVPEGWTARLVRTGLDQLVSAAGEAAARVSPAGPVESPSLALAVSCIGRQLLLQLRVTEELQRVATVLGEKAQIAGFYSYGELAPSGENPACDLHNQTITLTLLSETGQAA